VCRQKSILERIHSGTGFSAAQGEMGKEKKIPALTNRAAIQELISESADMRPVFYYKNLA